MNLFRSSIYQTCSMELYLSSLAQSSNSGRRIFFIHRLFEMNNEKLRVSKFSFMIRALIMMTTMTLIYQVDYLKVI